MQVYMKPRSHEFENRQMRRQDPARRSPLPANRALLAHEHGFPGVQYKTAMDPAATRSPLNGLRFPH
jgi:hypothetical protein